MGWFGGFNFGNQFNLKYNIKKIIFVTDTVYIKYNDGSEYNHSFENLMNVKNTSKKC